MFIALPTAIDAETPELVEAVAPTYPVLPSGGRESGEVQVEISIRASGEVANAKAISGPERLRASAEVAARKWRFKPQDKPTAKGLLVFGFNLRSGLGEPSTMPPVFKIPSRIDVFTEERKVVMISDPAVYDVDKTRKKKY